MKPERREDDFIRSPSFQEWLLHAGGPKTNGHLKERQNVRNIPYIDNEKRIEVITLSRPLAFCHGEGVSGHPGVFLDLSVYEQAVCPYCGQKFQTLPMQTGAFRFSEIIFINKVIICTFLSHF